MEADAYDKRLLDLQRTVENLMKAIAEAHAGVKMMTNVLIQHDQRLRALEKAERRSIKRPSLLVPSVLSEVGHG